MPITRMNHFTILAEDLESTKAFYVGLLGLHEGERPPLGFPGAWLYAAGEPVLHVIAGRSLPAERRGVLDHMAFSAEDLPGTMARLTAAKVGFELRRQPVSALWQLFVSDPNGARVELDFSANESPPA